MDKNEAVEIYKDRAAKFRNTQSIQWKMNLSVWTLLVLAIHYKSDLGDFCCQWPCVYFPNILLALIPIVHVVYCTLTQSSLEFDKKFNDHILSQLSDSNISNVSIRITDIEKSPIGWRGIVWISLQSLITIVLLSLFYFSTAN